jgi:hypothetical protein
MKKVKKVRPMKARPSATNLRGRRLAVAGRTELEQDEKSADPVDAYSFADSRREIRIGLDEDAMIAHLDEAARLEDEAEIQSFEAQEALKAEGLLERLRSGETAEEPTVADIVVADELVDERFANMALSLPMTIGSRRARLTEQGYLRDKSASRREREDRVRHDRRPWRQLRERAA